MLQNLSYNFRRKCQNIFWTLVSSLAQWWSQYRLCPYRLFPDICLVRYYERKYATILFYLNILAFFSNTCVVKLLSLELQRFFESLVFDSLVSKELIISLAQYLSKYLVCLYKLFPDICHVRYYEGSYATILFSLKNLAFFQKLVLTTTS